MSAKFTFDKNGYITPYQVHSGSIKTIRKCFVDPYNGTSTTRNMIWRKYSDYTRELYTRIKIPFKQMYFGSFISKKKSPTDIDVLNIVHHTKATLIQDMQGETALREYATDAYFIPEYDTDSPHYAITKALIDKKIEFGLFDDRRKERRSMIEVEVKR